MISCCPPPPMPWNAASGASARCKRVSTGCGRKRRSVRVLRWICGVKPTLKAVNKPLYHSIVHVLDKPGSSATVSTFQVFQFLFVPVDAAHRQPQLGRQEPAPPWDE